MNNESTQQSALSGTGSVLAAVMIALLVLALSFRGPSSNARVLREANTTAAIQVSARTESPPELVECTSAASNDTIAIRAVFPEKVTLTSVWQIKAMSKRGENWVNLDISALELIRTKPRGAPEYLEVPDSFHAVHLEGPPGFVFMMMRIIWCSRIAPSYRIPNFPLVKQT